MKQIAITWIAVAVSIVPDGWLHGFGSDSGRVKDYAACICRQQKKHKVNQRGC